MIAQRCTIGVTAILASLAAALATLSIAQDLPSQMPVKVQPPKNLVSKAKEPDAGQRARQRAKASIGAGPTQIDTADRIEDQDALWVEEFDMDSDGKKESAEVLWDDETKILFMDDQGPVTCTSGGEGEGELLMAIYAKDNAMQKPAGSGWYVVALEAGECGAPAPGLYGCRFDAQGRSTECGAAIVIKETHDLSITAPAPDRSASEATPPVKG